MSACSDLRFGVHGGRALSSGSVPYANALVPCASPRRQHTPLPGAPRERLEGGGEREIDASKSCSQTVTRRSILTLHSQHSLTFTAAWWPRRTCKGSTGVPAPQIITMLSLPPLASCRPSADHLRPHTSSVCTLAQPVQCSA